MEIDKKQYGEYVKQKTPVHSTFKNVLAAFLTGGLICMIGQILLNLFKEGGLEKDAAAAWTLLILILLSVVLTGLNIFQKIACFAGAGVLPTLWLPPPLSTKRKARFLVWAARYSQSPGRLSSTGFWCPGRSVLSV